jgi:chorismate synthase
VHPVLNCPDLAAAQAMYDKILEIKDQGDSSGGVVEVVAETPTIQKLGGMGAIVRY